MAMGTTGTVNITQKMMTDVKDAVTAYRDLAKLDSDALEAVVTGIIPTNFSGAAANGFKSYYTKNIVPAIGESLEKLLTAIDTIADGASDALPGVPGLDEQLGTGNDQGGGEQ